MKHYFLIVALVVLGFAREQAADHDHDIDYVTVEGFCAAEKEISLEVLEQAELGKFSSANDDNKLNCYAECVFTHAGLADEESVHYDRVKDWAFNDGGDAYVAAVEGCSNNEGADMCETTYNIYKCYYQAINKL